MAGEIPSSGPGPDFDVEDLYGPSGYARSGFEEKAREWNVGPVTIHGVHDAEFRQRVKEKAVRVGTDYVQAMKDAAVDAAKHPGRTAKRMTVGYAKSFIPGLTPDTIGVYQLLGMEVGLFEQALISPLIPGSGWIKAGINFAVHQGIYKSMEAYYSQKRQKIENTNYAAATDEEKATLIAERIKDLEASHGLANKRLRSFMLGVARASSLRSAGVLVHELQSINVSAITPSPEASTPAPKAPEGVIEQPTVVRPLASVDEIMKRGPQNESEALLLSNHGVLDIHEGKMGEALIKKELSIKYLEDYVSKNPQDDPAARRLEDFRQELNEFRKAIAMDPNEILTRGPKGLYEKGRLIEDANANVASGKLGLALREYEVVLATYPPDLREGQVGWVQRQDLLNRINRIKAATSATATAVPPTPAPTPEPTKLPPTLVPIPTEIPKPRSVPTTKPEDLRAEPAKPTSVPTPPGGVRLSEVDPPKFSAGADEHAVSKVIAHAEVGIHAQVSGQADGHIIGLRPNETLSVEDPAQLFEKAKAKGADLEALIHNIGKTQAFNHEAAGEVGKHLDMVDKAVNSYLQENKIDPVKLSPTKLAAIKRAVQSKLEQDVNMSYENGIRYYLQHEGGYKDAINAGRSAYESLMVNPEELANLKVIVGNQVNMESNLVQKITSQIHSELGLQEASPSVPLHDTLDLKEKLMPLGSNVGWEVVRAGNTIDWGSKGANWMAAEVAVNYRELTGYYSELAAAHSLPPEAHFPMNLGELEFLRINALNGDPEALRKLKEALKWFRSGRRFIVLRQPGIEKVLKVLNQNGPK